MPESPTGPRAAYIEDYNEDAKTTLPETRQTANIAAKRSKPDIVKGNIVGAVHDEFSDSGYSSRTGATLGSGDSSLDSKTGAAPLKVNSAAVISKGRSSGSHQEQNQVVHNLRRPTLRRTDLRAQERGSKTQQECRCDDSTAKGHHTTKSLEKSRSVGDGVVAKTTSKAPPPIAVPLRPQSTKPLPPKPLREVPVLQSTQTRPRAMTSQSYRKQRPVSFHSGSLPPQVSYQPVYVAQAQPTINTPSPLPPPSYPPSHSYFPPSAPVQHTPYPYSAPLSPLERRPPARWWNSDQPAAQRQSIVYSASPIIEHVQQPQYKPPVLPQPIIRRTSVQRGYQHPPRKEQHYVRDEDYYRMPPPPPPEPQTQRPTMRHAATTSVAHAALYQRRDSRADADQDSPQSPVKGAAPARENTQRPSIATRPSASSNYSSGSSSYAIERDMRRQSIGSYSASARSRRPLSYYGHESAHELERSVEAYQASTDTGPAMPLTADSLNNIRKKTHTGSETGSRLSTQSKGSKRSSEGKARSSTDRRRGSDVKSRNEQDGLTLQFNASQAVNVDFKGASVEGRTISLRPSNDGAGNNMVLGIGGKSGTTSSRASLKGRKRYSYVESTGVRELETAGGASRPTRESKTRESSRAPEKRVAVSRSRRNSKSGRN